MPLLRCGGRALIVEAVEPRVVVGQLGVRRHRVRVEKPAVIAGDRRKQLESAVDPRDLRRAVTCTHRARHPFTRVGIASERHEMTDQLMEHERHPLLLQNQQRRREYKLRVQNQKHLKLQHKLHQKEKVKLYFYQCKKHKLHRHLRKQDLLVAVQHQVLPVKLD